MEIIHEISEVTKYIDGLRAIIFDMDDTLYGEKEYVQSGYRKVAEHLSQIADAYAKLWKAFEQKQSAFDVVLKDADIYSEELKKECLFIYRFHEPDIHLYEGVEALLQSLRGQGYRLGVITDGRSEGQRAKIRVLGLEALVDDIIITDELGGIEFRKPCDLAFRNMAEKWQIPFDKICYVGDNVKKDFIAPEALGMRAIWYQNADGLYFDAKG